MPARPDALTLLRLLRVPTFLDEPTTKPVENYADFFVAVEYSDREFTTFSQTLLKSINEADLSSVSTAENIDKVRELLVDTVHDMLTTLMAKRARRNRLTDNASRHAPNEAGLPSRTLEKSVDRALEGLFRDAHTLIGPIVLDGSMPIIDVEIDEKYSAQATRTLRSSTDPVFKSHKSDIVMSITIQVPANRINPTESASSLYSLLSTLKTFPVCEIVSSAITPVYVNSILAPEVFESVRQKIKAEVDSSPVRVDRGEQLRALKDPSFGTSLDNFKAFIGNLNPVIDFMVRTDDMTREEDGTPLIKNDPDFTTAAARLRSYTGAVSISCAYMGAIVKTAPGRTNELIVKLFFRRFNDKVWSPLGKIFYRDIHGDPTPDPTQCPWIQKISNMVFGEDKSLNYMKKYDHYHAEEDSGILFTWTNQYDPENPFTFAPHGKSWVMSEIECRSFMKMVQLPMLGSPYPTVQYMGLDNLHVRISTTITDAAELARLHEMKASLDQINYASGPANLRNHYVSIDNNVINFLGGYDFVITGITTSRVNEDDVWDVEIELLESSVSHEDTESIVIKDETYKQKNDVKKIWDKIYELLSEKSEHTFYRYGRTENTKDTKNAYLTFPLDPEHPKEDELDKEGQLAWELVFGEAGSRGSRSLLQPNIMAAAWYSLAVKNGESKKRISWNTSYRENPKIAAVLEGRSLDSSLFIKLTNDRVDGDSSDLLVARYYQGAEEKDVKDFGFVLTGRYNPLSIFDVVGRDNPVREMTPREGLLSNLGLGNFKLNEYERKTQAKALDWLSKGQYDIGVTKDWSLHEFDIWSNNVLSEAAQTNIFEQGKELLEWMAHGDNRRHVFFSREFWNEYFNIVYNNVVRPDTDTHPAWTNADILDARVKLSSLLLEGVYLEFPSLKQEKFETLTAESKYVQTNISKEDVDKEELRSKYIARKSNYADFKLPTYSKVFSEDGKLMRYKDTGDPLWLKFAPTFSDLGIKPPYLRQIAFNSIPEQMNQCARSVNDPIEPDCVYYHFRYKSEAFASFLQDQKRIDDHLAAIKSAKAIVVPAEIARNGASAVDNYLKEVWKLPSDRYMREAFNRREDHETLRNIGDAGQINSVSVIDEEGAYLGTVTHDSHSKQGITFSRYKGTAPKIFSGGGSSVVDPYSGTEIFKTARDLLVRTEDRTGSMSKIFPAYRLYFIEKDRGYKFLCDDLYGVNSLISISLRKDKEDADVLVAQISNVTGNLSTERVLTPQQTQALGLLPDDEGEAFFSSLKLQSGVLVQLRLGYGSNPDDLPIVFTGMITEIRPGKIVEITCQGHKRELLNEVQFEMESINHFDIVRKILEKTEHPNLGESVGAGRSTWTTIASKFPEGQNPHLYIGSSDVTFNRNVVDMGNVYLTSNAPLESGRKVYFDTRDSFFSQPDVRGLMAVGTLGISELIRNGAELGDAEGEGASRFGNGLMNIRQFLTETFTPDSVWVDVAYTNGKWAKWIIPPQTAWDAIQEVTRHRPGHIAQVVPFDTRGTLFVGQPEQAYRFTEPSHVESLTYATLQTALSNQTKIDFLNDLIKPFLDSFWAKLYLAHFKAVETFNYTRNSDIYSSRTDASVFVNPEDILELEDLPDEDDREAVKDALKDDQYLDAKAKDVISRIAGTPLIGSFEIMEHWWMYSLDLTPHVAKLESLYPGITDALFIWYYDLDPIAVTQKFSNISNLIKPLFFTPQGPTFTNFTEELLYASETEFSVQYESIANASASNNRYKFTFGKEDSQLEFLITQGLLTREEASLIKSDVNKSSARHVFFRSVLLDNPYSYMRNNLKQSFREVLANTAGGFRLFLFNMYWFITRDLTATDPKLNAANVANSATNLRVADLPPGMKVFRAYHHITMGDIIENNIQASMDEMSNCCLVRAPASEIEYELEDGEDQNGEDVEEVIVEFEETDWRSYPTTDGAPYTWKIGKDQRKLGVVYELNAIHPNQKAKTLMSNMGSMLSLMYRGSIVVVGRDIKPHDIVYINDTENDLRGHFEVDSVVHHFSVATGWVSEIKPCAFVRVNNPTAEIQLASVQGFLSKLQVLLDVLDVGLTVLMIAGFVFNPALGALVRGGLAAGSKALATKGGAEAAKKVVATGVKNYATNVGTYAKGFFGGVGRTFKIETALTAGEAAAHSKSKALAVANYIGGLVSPRGLGLYAALYTATSAAAIATSIYTKHVLSSTELPIDVHLLLYRGEPFQAGLGTEQEDIYSIYEKFAGAAKDIKDDFGDFISGLADDIAGVRKNESPYERIKKAREK